MEKEGTKREHMKQTDTNWIKQLKRHNMLFRNWLEWQRNTRTGWRAEINRNNLKNKSTKHETEKNRCQGKWH